MTEAKHTPGPWVADFGEAFHIRPSEGGTLAQVTFLKGRGGLGGRRNADECAANARLIAAAPDLLEALELWRDRISGPTEMSMQTLLHMTDAAIAKARGEA